MKNHILFLIFSVFAFNAKSQTFKKYFGGVNTDCGNSIITSSDGGFAVVGSSNSSGNKQVYLVKTDSSGKELWNASFGGKNFEDGINIKNTSDHGYIICGITKSFKETYDGDVYVIKTDSIGKELWSKYYGGEKMEIGNAVLQTGDGSYLVAGNRIMPDKTQDMYLLKLDNKGSELWNRTYSSVTTYDAECKGVVETLKGGVVIGGAMQNAKGYNNTLIQLSTEKDSSWQSNSGGIESNHLNSLIAYSDSGFVFCGTIGGGTGNAFIMKTNKYGKKIWSKNLGIPENSESFNSVIETKDHGIVAVGSTTGKGNGKFDVYLVKFDNKGKLLWEKFLGTPSDDFGNSVIETKSGDLVITGTSSSIPTMKEQILIYRTNANGDIEN